ncbi:hypothetical protein K474DRAFT_683461 [Panus rudis PR-1116 ss-1]|nr:hypothetical protein K474DRAFT_683461 [Panus rudis PR-1116 ss-1]
MARLADLPPELLLHILQFIPLPSLLRVSALSHEWRRFFIEHESTIFRNAAIKHNFARPEVIHVDEARRAYAAKFLRDVQDWKTFCKQLYLLFQSWAGRGPVEIKALTECSFNVHRIKVDEEAGIVLTTHTTGGLRVTDLETDKLLWALPETYVRSWAHCEYQNGFLIFDRFGEYKEIWRLTMVDEESPPEPPPGRQDQVQIQLGEGTARIARIIRSRLYFRPWALLSTPEWGQAFRFVYPYLLVASLTKAYVYDVVSAILVQTIEDTQNVNDPTNVQLGDINYVELNDKYVFICGSIELRIYSRSNGGCTIAP